MMEISVRNVDLSHRCYRCECLEVCVVLLALNMPYGPNNKQPNVLSLLFVIDAFTADPNLSVMKFARTSANSTL